MRGDSVKLKKYKFGKDLVEYLGYIVGQGHVLMDPSKVQAITECLAQTFNKHIQQFLGIYNYSHCFIRNYTKLSAPLSDLLYKDKAWVGSDVQDTVFTELKIAFITAPVLKIPQFDHPIALKTEVSDHTIGAVLLQYASSEGSPLLPVAFYSKKLNATKHKYPVHDHVMLAIIQAYSKQHYNLINKEVMVFTDHKTLQYLQKQPKLNSLQVHWLNFIANYRLDIRYRPSRASTVLDSQPRLLHSSLLVPLMLAKASIVGSAGASQAAGK